LLDPAVLARTLPGAAGLEQTGEHSFKGALNVQVGPVKGQFQGTLELTDVAPLTGYHMKLSGSGPSGFMNGQGTLKLADAEGGGTRVIYDLDADVGGRIAGVGQRLLESSAKVITRQGLEGLGRELAALKEAEATATPMVPPVQPTQTVLAAKVAGGVLAELVPQQRRPWLVGAVLLVLALVIFLFVRGCG